MSRTIADLAAGTLLYVDETVNGVTRHIPYIYLGLDENGNSRILRQYATQTIWWDDSTVASYAGSTSDNWLNDETTGFLGRFDSETLNALQYTSIKYIDYTQSSDNSAQIVQISRRCFYLGFSEEGWGTYAGLSDGISYLPALEAFTGLHGGNARITRDETETIVAAWIRSANSISAAIAVHQNSNAGFYNPRANNWARPALSVAPLTKVSDEGATEIFLLPDGRKTTWTVAFEMELGDSEQRPNCANVDIDGNDIVDKMIYVCNNYGDAEPSWVVCSDSGFAMLENDSKSTQNWEIGLKVNVELSAPTYVGEPVVLIQVD